MAVKSRTSESIYGWNDDTLAKVESDGVLDFHLDKGIAKQQMSVKVSPDDGSYTKADEGVSTRGDEDTDDADHPYFAPEGVEGQ